VDAKAVAQVLAREATTATFRDTGLAEARLETDPAVLAKDPSLLDPLRAGLDEAVEEIAKQAEGRLE